MSKDSLGDRMKFFEGMSNSQKLYHTIPIMIRLDGVAFHNFTKGLKRPYDERLSQIMVETTKFLCQLINARIGYTQSDEISLILFSDVFESSVLYDGKFFKLCSTLASKASVFFNKLLPESLPEKKEESPVFDCRIWNVPSKIEAVNTLIWREKDATRNSISMAAQSCFSHGELQKKSSSELQEMLYNHFRINWNNYPTFFKRGTYIQRKKIERAFTADELQVLPEKHAARKNPELKIQRTDWAFIDLPPIAKIKNRVEVVFDGAEPELFEV